MHHSSAHFSLRESKHDSSSSVAQRRERHDVRVASSGKDSDFSADPLDNASILSIYQQPGTSSAWRGDRSRPQATRARGFRWSGTSRTVPSVVRFLAIL
ncbi:hypothetical protein HDG39_001478 [Paraburkholderia sp. WSM4180]|nr:hypothetical protein [Paraburkholderia sp. WSM4180]